MNRREFAKNVVGATVGAATLSLGPNVARGAKIGNTGKGDASHVPFELSVMLWTISPALPFEQRIAMVAQAGYKNVELVGEYTGWSEDDFLRAIAKRKELGITFDATAGLKHGVANPNGREGFLADLREALSFMERLACPSIIVLSGDVAAGMTREMQHQSCVEGLEAAAALVEGKKINGEPVRLLLETIDPEENPRYFLTSMTEGFEIIKSVNHRQVQMVYDLFHEQIAEGNLIEKLEKNIQQVGLVHVADVPGRHEPGTGEINYENIFRKLAELKYDRVVAMEFIPTGDPVQKLRDAREMVLRAVR
jgi:hydroxypyruvate isomerase